MVSPRRLLLWSRRLPKILPRALLPHTPLLVQLVPIRRCNLDCSYCNEYDKVSPPVPLDVLCDRIDRLDQLRACSIVLTGGEPLEHPEILDIVRHIHDRGMISGVLTNGMKLNANTIQGLNEAGLDGLQVSIDNASPDEVSQKSLASLANPLEALHMHATFHVNINSVIGAGIREPYNALAVAEVARHYGFTSTMGIIHDGTGQVPGAGEHGSPLDRHSRRVYEVLRRRESVWPGIRRNQDAMVAGKPVTWTCRAGGRYLYVCEHGFVHWCSQQRNRWKVPLEQYTDADLRKWSATAKGCESHCTVGCVQRISRLSWGQQTDRWTPTVPSEAECACSPAHLTPAAAAVSFHKTRPH